MACDMLEVRMDDLQGPSGWKLLGSGGMELHV